MSRNQRMPWKTREGSKLNRRERMKFRSEQFEDDKRREERRNSKKWHKERRRQIEEFE